MNKKDVYLMLDLLDWLNSEPKEETITLPRKDFMKIYEYIKYLKKDIKTLEEKVKILEGGK